MCKGGKMRKKDGGNWGRGWGGGGGRGGVGIKASQGI